MFWGIDEANAVGRIAEVGLPAGHTLENPLLAFDAQILVIIQNRGNISNERFALMGIELIAKNDEMSLWIRLDKAFDMLGKVGFRSGISNGRANELTSSQVKVARENLGSMSDIVELPTLDMACLHGKGLAITLQGLDARFLVDTNHMRSLSVLFLSCGMQLTDGCRLLGECLPVVDVGIFPVATPMRLKLSLLLKNGSHEPARCLSRSPLR